MDEHAMSLACECIVQTSRLEVGMVWGSCQQGHQQGSMTRQQGSQQTFMTVTHQQAGVNPSFRLSVLQETFESEFQRPHDT